MPSCATCSARCNSATDVKAVVLTGAGGNFCSGGDVHEIIGPLTKMSMPELLEFTRMTGDLVKAMRRCPQPIVAAIDGICAGAGAMMALAADMRLGTAAAKTAFLFTRVGLAGADMGACALLPRVIGQGRASELLFTGRAMTRRRKAWPGASSTPCTTRPSCCAKAQALARRAGRRPDLRPRHDQDHAAPGVGHDARPGDRGRGAGAGDLHADAGLHARLRGLRGASRSRCSRETEHVIRPRCHDHLALPFFDDAHRALGARPGGLGAAQEVDETRRPRAPAASGCAGSATPAGCATACPPAPAARWTSSTRARW